MPYGYRSRKAPFNRRRPYRSYRRRYTRRSRFSSKKKFFKYSNKQRTVVRPSIQARELYVKLPWKQTTTQTATGSGSIDFSFLGNSLIPNPASTSPSAGEIWAAGTTEYAAFYEYYRVLGSSINIRIVTVEATNGPIRCVLLPIAGPINDLSTKITELDGYTYDQLTMLPYAQSRVVGLGNTSNTYTTFKMFRKTKSMVGIKDLRDEDTTRATLPDVDGSAGSGSLIVSGNVWFYYFKVFNVSASNSAFQLEVKMSYYVQMLGRDSTVATSVPA